ncbi:Ubiquitin carboxyl-terminal hydrolase 26 [Sciurus carolinensis]|uniref:Ubiquitin carboxyl-terminal hydrolase n=1 Tax=Sciurus carolinensis TaxID=30640 RepID=A0AA41N8H8_SCICA|nr:Ubiquitin carboxyl-terminal hydrolase 26 [Sciurus carolinensis]
MAAVSVHGYVQIWNTKTGMSKSTAAFIEPLEGKKKVKLALYFNTGQIKTFLLSDNIKSVVFRSYGENENHLHLTFQNNDFLFIERLSSTDARELKIFLDRVHQDREQPPMKPNEGDDVFTSTTIRKGVIKTSSHKVYKKSISECIEVDKEGTSYLQKMSLFMEKSTFISKGLFEDQFGKRKRIPASGLEMNENEKFLKENDFKRSTYKINPLKCISQIWEKQLKSRELKEKKKLAFGSSFVSNFFGNPYLDVTIPHTITEKVFVPFFWEPNYSQYVPEGDIFENSLTFFPEKLWQGLPNLGNTCYMNAVLQSLCSIPSFVNDLLNQGFPWGKIPHDALNLCLAQMLVLKDIYNIKTKGKLLVSIKNAISLVADIFSGDGQNDAHEFLSVCLDQMKETMKRLSLMWKTKIESGEEDSLEKLLFGYFPAKMIACPVITNFEFEILRTIFCKSCGRAVLKTEPNNYLSINLPQGPKAHPLSIQSTFDLFFDAEELEYKCEQCNHNRSIAVHKFSRLPRVLIVHLKRYSFNEFWSLRKDEQEVIIPTYLKLSSHCNENTKPPLPLSKNAHIKDFRLLKIFQKMSFGILNLTIPSTKSTSKSKDALAFHIGSNKKPVPRKRRQFLKGAGREQQKKDLQKYSKVNIIKSASSGDAMLVEKKLLAGSMMYLKDTSISLICKDGVKPSPDTSLAEAHLQEVLENTDLKKHEDTNRFIELDSGCFSETNEDLYEDKNPTIPGRFQNVSRQTQQCDSVRIHKQALPPGLPKLNAQEHTHSLRATELNVQKANVNSRCSVDSSGNPEDNLDKTESKAREPKRNADKGDLHTYRLIGVLSHIGNTTQSGHYISDAYDFKRHLWFTYNDLQVSSIQEVQVQKSRLCTGYIFFYMHNEIFEELLVRGENSQSFSTKARKTPQAQ